MQLEQCITNVRSQEVPHSIADTMVISILLNLNVTCTGLCSSTSLFIEGAKLSEATVRGTVRTSDLYCPSCGGMPARSVAKVAHGRDTNTGGRKAQLPPQYYYCDPSDSAPVTCSDC